MTRWFVRLCLIHIFPSFAVSKKKKKKLVLHSWAETAFLHFWPEQMCVSWLWIFRFFFFFLVERIFRFSCVRHGGTTCWKLAEAEPEPAAGWSSEQLLLSSRRLQVRGWGPGCRRRWYCRAPAPAPACGLTNRHSDPGRPQRWAPLQNVLCNATRTAKSSVID